MAPNEINPNDAGGTSPDKEWTVMFLFAGDNELAPLIVSQLKSIKDASFHPQVDVVVQFDPCAAGVATKLLHVNRKRDGSRHVGKNGRLNSFVHNMDSDTVRPEEIDVGRGEASAKMQAALKSPDRVPALDALKNFLGYCRENHRARNYVLFLVGHGLVVGNDAFLPDEHPKSAVKLADLREALKTFSDGGGTLQLLALHSCAMSAVEVAYELKGTARYMIGSEGVSYVGSWPYRNMLVKLFNTVKDAGSAAAGGAAGSGVDVEALVENLYLHSLHNATDFILTGYSLDLALCSLEPKKYEPLSESIRGLVRRLKEAVRTERGREVILLAHWEAQSYWDENYTDLFDFCHCLERRCLSLADMLGGYEKARDEVERLRGLAAACGAVSGLLSPKQSKKRAERFEALVVRADNFGTKYQYSHGLSVYFPWAEPLDDDPPPPAPVAPTSRQRTPKTKTDGGKPTNAVLDNYAGYAFSRELGEEESWLAFLNVYFRETKRKPRRVEEAAGKKGDGARNGNDDGGKAKRQSDARQLLSRSFHAGALAKETGSYSKETGSYGDCACPSVKNYPTEEIDNLNVVVREFSCTTEVLSGVEEKAPPVEVP